MNRMTLLVLVPLFLVTMGNYCGPDIIDDAGFQFWCGDQLCAWTLEEGAVRKVTTWHEHDYAVELVGAPVILSQRATESSPSCVRIEIIADAEESAMLSIAIDVDGNGLNDWGARIFGEGFQSMAWELRGDIAPHAGSIFTLTKKGEGRAVVAQLRASSECEGDG
ncbi:MAG: hypothetical protein WCF10_18990 [Polyangiales bacterium]